MRRAHLVLLALMIAASARAQTTTTRTDRVIVSTSVTIGGTSFTPTAAVFGGTVSATSGLSSFGTVKVSGTAGIPAAGGTDFFLTGGSGIATARALIGDGSGWEFLFSSRTGSATTDRVSVTDTGTVRPATAYTGNLGQYDRKWLTLHAAELWVSTLVAQDVMSTIGGRVVIAPTTVLSADLAAAGTTITVKHNQIANGDRVVLESNGQVEWMAVTSAAGGSAGAYTYSVTRNLDGSGANDWKAGDAVMNTGTTGDGYIDLYADNGLLPGTTVGPTIVGNYRTGTTYSNIAPRWAAGNLNGLFGIGSDTYGFAAGDPSATYFTMDASNGFQIYNGATKKFWLTTGGVMALYDSSTTYLQLTGGAIKMVEGGIEVFNLSSGVATFGRPLTSNNTGQIQIDSDSIDFRWRNNSGSTSTVLQISNSAGDAYFSMTGAMAISAYLRVPSVTNSAGDLIVGSEAVLGDVILSATGATRPDADGNRSLGESGYRWQKLFLLPTTTTATFNPLVLGTSGEVWEKTDGVSATFNPTTCTSMTFEGGILTAKAGC